MNKSIESPPSYDDVAPSFGKTLEQVLKHYNDAFWLGEYSPLAAPYLLHEYLDTAAATIEARGTALQEVLKIAVTQIAGDKHRERNRTIIEGRYFQKLSEVQMLKRLHLQKKTYHDSRKRAILALEAALIRLLNPAIRLESPPLAPPYLVEREQLIWCQQELNGRNSVAIAGSGGVGKTTLGGCLARQWAHGPTFWYTIRPGLNDQPTSLLFALGYFLSKYDEPSLWLEVVALAGNIEMERTVSMMRYALEQLAQRALTPLLCFDEVDLLQPAKYGEHDQMVTLLNSLRAFTPLLLIGQQAVVDAAIFCHVDGIPEYATADLLAAHDIKLSEDVQHKLYTYTHGNPRLLTLAITLERYGEAITDVVTQLSAAPSLTYLLSRILQRLDEVVCRGLLELAVYQGPAPADIWRDLESDRALAELLDRHLVQTDGRGGVMLLPAYRDLLYREMPDAKRRQLHTQAAVMLAARGSYTDAARHCIWAGKPEQAIWLWRDQQQVEINQGQGQAALHLFRDLTTMDLSPTAQQALRLLCAHLERLAGNVPQAQKDIYAVLEKTSLFDIEAHLLDGVIANDLSEFDHAESAFRHALGSAETLTGARLAHIRKGLGWMHMRQRDITNAWQEALLARYEAENFQGYIQEIRCEYPEAEAHYLSALKLAQEIDAKEGIANTCNNLATLYARQGRFDEAKAYLAQADDCWASIGKLSYLISANISWAFIYNLAGDYEDAIEALQRAIDEFAKFKLTMPTWQKALINQGLAEAYLGWRKLDEAHTVVLEAIAQEEPDILPDSYRTLGEILLALRDLNEARKFVQMSIDLTDQDESPDAYLGGYAWRALAQVYLAAGKSAQANEAKNKAITLFEEINLPYEVNKTQAMVEI